MALAESETPQSTSIVDAHDRCVGAYLPRVEREATLGDDPTKQERSADELLLFRR